jgi:hypothetical protein
MFRSDVAGATSAALMRKANVLYLTLNAAGAIEAGAYNGSTFDVATTTVTPAAGTWYHVVVTWDGATVSVYVNGALSKTVAHTTQATNSNTFTFGSADGSSLWFHGALAHAFITQGAMTAADVSTLYAAVSSAPHVPVSATGIVETSASPVRFDSAYNQLAQIVKDFGLQVSAEPMQLESGEFPGRLRPLVRVGRDTEFRVGSPQVRLPTATNIKDEITAEEVADALVADAQGLADPAGAAQLAAEIFNFAGLRGTIAGVAQAVHPWVSAEYNQQNDISVRELLLQRLTSLLALEGSPWEQVSMEHGPTRQLLDTFPLTGAAALFEWAAGDGVRLNFPELGVVDQSPRQVLGVSWPIRPDGVGAPSISLRQRPRNFRQVLRDMLRTALSGQRSYQGQLVAVTGNLAGNAGASDAYSRVSLPSDLSRVTAAWLVVTALSGTGWTIEVNDVSTGAGVSAPGRYNILPWLAKAGNAPWMYVRLVGGPSTTSAASYMVELTRTE